MFASVDRHSRGSEGARSSRADRRGQLCRLLSPKNQGKCMYPRRSSPCRPHNSQTMSSVRPLNRPNHRFNSLGRRQADIVHECSPREETQRQQQHGAPLRVQRPAQHFSIEAILGQNRNSTICLVTAWYSTSRRRKRRAPRCVGTIHRARSGRRGGERDGPRSFATVRHSAADRAPPWRVTNRRD